MEEGVQVVVVLSADHGGVLASAAGGPSRDLGAEAGTGEVMAIYCYPPHVAAGTDVRCTTPLWTAWSAAVLMRRRYGC